MRIARFMDGTGCRLEVIRGDLFVAREGETYLFEMPDGTLKLGRVGAEDEEPFVERFPRFAAVFDRDAGVITLAL